MRLKISARKSDLARLQAYRVAEALRQKNPQIEIEFLFKESLGDKNLTDPLWKIPDKGVFTEDFFQELVTGKTDMVVHSWKDLPTETKSETMIAATLPRADQRDLLLFKKSDLKMVQETKRLRIYSSSPRRAYNLGDFLKEAFPARLNQVEFESVRGNIPTRIRKLMESQDCSALVVAKAALDRLLAAPEAEFQPTQIEIRNFLQKLNWMVLPLSVNPNAAAQGALAIEILRSRTDLQEILSSINDQKTFQAATQERQVLARFGGGCHQKIGVAVLNQEYGTVQICRGLTDAGEKLEQFEIVSPTKPRFHAEEMWSGNSDSFFSRENLPFEPPPQGTNAVFVAKAQAWPENLEFEGLVWTAGIATWKKLATQNKWVHGTQDGFGEYDHGNDTERLETIFGNKIKWVKLSHEAGIQDSDKKTLATYRLKPDRLTDLSGKKAFYWTSGSQFLRALELNPSILEKSHACGPGHTYQVISRELQNRRPEKVNQVEIYLNIEEWKQKCQK